MKKILSTLLLLFSTAPLLATQWSPFKPASLDFASPHVYAAKEPLGKWYRQFFYNSFSEREKELVDIIENNTTDPIYCTKLTTGSVTSKFCNPWVIAVFIKDGYYYLTHRRYKFFDTVNHMEILKMNLALDDYDHFEKIVLPFASTYEAPQLSPTQRLLLSFYYIYDYQINDNCFDYECEDKVRLKRKLRINPQQDQFSWIHRTLLSGCAQGGNCITARQITYTVSIDFPTLWRNQADDYVFPNSWYGSTLWHQLNQSWVTGLHELQYFSSNNSSGPIEIPNLPLP